MDANRKEILIYRAWRLRLVLGLAVLVAVVGGWELYQFGRSRAGGDLESLYAERGRLQAQLGELDVRNAALERQIAVLERARQIDQQAYAVFKQERSGLQDELLGLREELAFYRGVMSPGTDKVGLHAQDFDLEPAVGTARYRYRFVLTQPGRRDQTAKGVVRLFVEGVQEGVARRLGLAEASDSGTEDIPYRFRYFQSIEGILQLPDGFLPERVTLQAVPANAPRLPLEWSFDWPSNQGGPAEEEE